MILVVKLVLVPVLIALITLAGARFGPRIAGVLTGLPVVAGPIVFFMALEQGPAFAARSATATLAAFGSLAAFCIVYALAALRSSWGTSTVLGWLAFLAATLGLHRLAPSLGVSIAIALVAPLVVTALTPRPPLPPAGARAVTRAEIVLRMLTGVGMMLILTGLAHLLGPRVSGLLTVFPVATTILAVFAHRNDGAAFAIHLIRGLATGLYCLGAFFIVLALALDHLNLATAFGCATIAAVLMQNVALRTTASVGIQSQA